MVKILLKWGALFVALGAALALLITAVVVLFTSYSFKIFWGIFALVLLIMLLWGFLKNEKHEQKNNRK